MRGEVAFYGREEVGRVDADGDEHVEDLDLGDVDGDQAGVGVVHEEVAAHCARGEVVDAAGAVGHVAHDEGLCAGAEGSDDVGQGAGEEEQAFGELEGDAFCGGGADGVDGFGELKVVVCGEEGGGFGEGGVVQD